MELGHIAITLTLLLNAGLLAWIALNVRSASKQIESTDRADGGVNLPQAPTGPIVEIRYFDYIEDHLGAVKNSKRFTVKGQVFVSGIPVGEQFVMSEQIVEEFSYEKIRQLKSEIIAPLVKVAADTYLAASGVPQVSSKAISKTIRAFKAKTG
ncbi:MAG: hypothetical protein J0L82_10225 [Deltaproteobacteria bacterium]|jgi:hypothetical protein|nr:hypothetical protein [Deltaproteobacteria bacterium]